MTDGPLEIVALLFPDLTQLDLTGPAEVFAQLPNAHVTLAWVDTEPVVTDGGWSIVPTSSFDDAPQADVLFVPGGNGVWPAMADDRVLDFLRRQAPGAAAVTSVCTGSFLLGAAGLLEGRRATTHWSSLPMLTAFGAIPVEERVVEDGPVLTGAGVTSGIDFALTLVARAYGDDLARDIQLQIEYDPQPPFDNGSARVADPAAIQAGRDAAWNRRLDALASATARLGYPAWPPLEAERQAQGLVPAETPAAS